MRDRLELLHRLLSVDGSLQLQARSRAARGTCWDDALDGLEKMSVKTADMRAALLAGGSLATPAEMKKPF